MKIRSTSWESTSTVFSTTFVLDTLPPLDEIDKASLSHASSLLQDKHPAKPPIGPGKSSSVPPGHGERYLSARVRLVKPVHGVNRVNLGRASLAQDSTTRGGGRGDSAVVGACL